MGDKGCRGFSLADDVRPVVAVNTWYRPEPRLFTYVHELAHLASDTSSICVGYEATKTERWCEEVAGVMLLPEKPLRDFMTGQLGVKAVTGRGQVSRIASKFKISLSATTVRLIRLGFAPQSLGVLIDHGRDSHTDSSGGKGERNSQKRIREWGAGFSALVLDAEQHSLLKQHVMLEYLDLPRTQLDEWRMLARAGEAGD
jgi:Zn-dependent peptidase ImmA (M78 family)